MDSTRINTQARVLTMSILNIYSKDYGEVKTRKLMESLENETGKIKAYLEIWQSKGIIPDQKELQKVIGSINWFVFSKRQTMAVACLILLVKWEKEVDYNSQAKVLQVALSIINYYKVYITESDNIVKSLLSENEEDKKNSIESNQLLNKVHECFEDGNNLIIYGVGHCGVVNSNLNPPTFTVIDNLVFEVKLSLRERGMFSADIMNVLPEYITNTFPAYINVDNTIYTSEYVNFRINNISFDSKKDVSFNLTTECYVDDEGEVILLKNPEYELHMSCIIGEEGIMVSCSEYSWNFILGGQIEEWFYN